MSSTEAMWFVVLEGEQTGPISAQDVEIYFRNGQIDAESFIWRDGLDDWVGLTTLSEFSHLAPTNGHASNGVNGAAHYGDPLADVFGEQGDNYEATRQVSAAEVFGSGYRPEAEEEADFGSTRVVSMGSLNTDAAADNAPPPAAAAPLPSSGFSFSAAAAVGGGALNLSKDPAPPAASSLDALSSLSSSEPSSGGMFDNAPRKSANDLVGARSENSVLFSLNNLRAVSAPTSGPGSKDLPTTEGSGLIDIKALASANQGPSPVDNRKSFSEGDAFDHAVVPVPAMMPMSNRKSNTGLFVAISIGALLILGLIGAVVWLIFFKTDPVQIVQTVAEEDRGIPGAPTTPGSEIGQGPGSNPTGGQLPPPTGGQLPPPTALPPPTQNPIAPVDGTNPTAAGTNTPPTTNPATNPDGTPIANTNPDGTPIANTNPDGTPPPPETPETEEERKEKEKKKKEREEKAKAEAEAKALADKAAADKAAADKAKADADAAANKTPDGPAAGGPTSTYALVPGDVTKVVNAEFGKISTCVSAADVKGTLIMSWKIKSDGRTSGVTTNSAEFKGSKVARCIERVVQGFRFPAHNKPEVPINNYKFNVN